MVRWSISKLEDFQVLNVPISIFAQVVVHLRLSNVIPTAIGCMMVIRHAAFATVSLATPFIGKRVTVFRRPCATSPISAQLEVHDDLLGAKDIGRIWTITRVLLI
jgi:hypothetical protein